MSVSETCVGVGGPPNVAMESALSRICKFLCLWFLYESSTSWVFPFRRKTFPHSTNDDFFMDLALSNARQAYRRQEVPIGALVVLNTSKHYEIIGSTYNLVETRKDASAHAELLALQKASQRMGNWRLYNCTLYSTLEPCSLCLSAALQFRVDRIVYGAPDHRLGAITSRMRLLEVPHPYHNVTEVKSGVHQSLSAKLLRSFFRERRKDKSQRSEVWLGNQATPASYVSSVLWHVSILSHWTSAPGRFQSWLPWLVGYSMPLSSAKKNRWKSLLLLLSPTVLLVVRSLRLLLVQQLSL